MLVLVGTVVDVSVVYVLESEVEASVVLDDVCAVVDDSTVLVLVGRVVDV